LKLEEPNLDHLIHKMDEVVLTDTVKRKKIST